MQDCLASEFAAYGGGGQLPTSPSLEDRSVVPHRNGVSCRGDRHRRRVPAVRVAAALAGTTIAAEPISGSPWIVLLIAVSAAYGYISFPTGKRSLYIFGQPTIVLAGFIGGPLVGLAAGVAPNLTESHGVWRRRAAYAGLDGLQGVLAGFWGLAVARGEIGLEAGLAFACAWALMISATGRVLAQLTRRSLETHRLAFDTGCEALEFLLVSPLLVLSARESCHSPGPGRPGGGVPARDHDDRLGGAPTPHASART